MAIAAIVLNVIAGEKQIELFATVDEDDLTSIVDGQGPNADDSTFGDYGLEDAEETDAASELIASLIIPEANEMNLISYLAL